MFMMVIAIEHCMYVCAVKTAECTSERFFCRFYIMQVEAEEEMQPANDARRHQVMMPERDRDTVSRPKRPVSVADVKRPSPSLAGYGYDADVISTHNKENMSRPTKFRVCGYVMYCMMFAMLAIINNECIYPWQLKVKSHLVLQPKMNGCALSSHLKNSQLFTNNITI